MSSVVYLTDASNPTLVLDQKSLGPPAERGWCAHPRAGAFLTFSGDLLHGVLPAPGKGRKMESAPTGAQTGARTVTEEKALEARTGGRIVGVKAAGPTTRCGVQYDEAALPRLTLLIAWYSEAAGGGRRRRRLGPAACMPRTTRSQTWPAMLAMSAEVSDGLPVPAPNARELRVRQCSPAWEAIPTAVQGQECSKAERAVGSTDPALEVPTSLQQHFFMRTVDEVDVRLKEEHGVGGTYTTATDAASKRRKAGGK